MALDCELARQELQTDGFAFPVRHIRVSRMVAKMKGTQVNGDEGGNQLRSIDCVQIGDKPGRWRLR